MQEPLLSVRELYTCFGNGKKIVHAVNGVSFDVHYGEVLGLVGESGCGKSATCRSLIQLIPSGGKVISGQILYKGRDIVQRTERELEKLRGKEIGMIFQEPMNTLNPVTTIGEQLMETMRAPGMTQKQKTARAVELLKLVDIPSPEERLKAYPHQFSGGMRQRAMIAIALASQPKLLLADEPTTALDVTIQQQIIRLLMDLRSRLNMSMILVTHDLGVASQMCDTIAVMYAGSLVEKAPARDLFSLPQHPYTYSLMQSIPTCEKKGRRLTPSPGAPPDLSEELQGCAFAPRCPYRQAICRTDTPPSLELAPQHLCRCHFAGKLAFSAGGAVPDKEGTQHGIH